MLKSLDEPNPRAEALRKRFSMASRHLGRRRTLHPAFVSAAIGAVVAGSAWLWTTTAQKMEAGETVVRVWRSGQPLAGEPRAVKVHGR